MKSRSVLISTIFLIGGCISPTDPIGEWSGKFFTRKDETKMSIQICLEDNGFGTMSIKSHDTGKEDRVNFAYYIRRFKSKNEGAIFLTPTGEDKLGFRFIVYKYNKSTLTLPFGKSEFRLMRK